MLCMRLRLVMSLVGRFIAYYVPAPVSALSALSVSAARRQFHFPSYRAQSEHGAHSENSEPSKHVTMIVTLLTIIGALTSLVNSQRNENIIKSR